jgi:hypothetical protein
LGKSLTIAADVVVTGTSQNSPTIAAWIAVSESSLVILDRPPPSGAGAKCSTGKF